MNIIAHNIPIPQLTVTEYLKQAAADIVDILQQTPSNLPFSLEVGDSLWNAILKLVDIFHTKETLPDIKHKDPLAPTAEPLHDASLPRVLKEQLQQHSISLLRVQQKNSNILLRVLKTNTKQSTAPIVSKRITRSQ